MCQEHDPEGERHAAVSTTDGGITGSVPDVVRCPRCRAEIRSDGDGSLEELVAAVQRHASASHNHQVGRERVLTRLGLTSASS